MVLGTVSVAVTGPTTGPTCPAFWRHGWTIQPVAKGSAQAWLARVGGTTRLAQGNTEQSAQSFARWVRRLGNIKHKSFIFLRTPQQVNDHACRALQNRE